jgi:hypothetical protein
MQPAAVSAYHRLTDGGMMKFLTAAAKFRPTTTNSNNDCFPLQRCLHTSLLKRNKSVMVARAKPPNIYAKKKKQNEKGSKIAPNFGIYVWQD